MRGRPDLLIDVTVDDIAVGIPGSRKACPIVFAAKRALDNLAPVTVQADRVWLPRRGYRLTTKAREFVRKFDNYEPVEPFTFTGIVA